MGRDNGFRFFSKEHIKEIQNMYKDVEKVQPMNVKIDQSTPWEEVGNTPEQDRIRNIYDSIYIQVDSSVSFNDDDEFDDDDIVDISNEEYRRYVFDKNRDVMILFPIFLYEDPENGEHVIVDRDEVTHVIPEGWITMQVEYIYG